MLLHLQSGEKYKERERRRAKYEADEDSRQKVAGNPELTFINKYIEIKQSPLSFVFLQLFYPAGPEEKPNNMAHKSVGLIQLSSAKNWVQNFSYFITTNWAGLIN